MESRSVTFEESFGRLQLAVERLEQGGLPLEAALDLFEQGMVLAADCAAILDRAELRLTRLLDTYAASLETDPED